jgi:predicted Zn-dependent protease
MPLSAGAQYAVLLPFSRKHELEADQIGLTYMARAGYDPRESVTFWKRMMAATQGAKPPKLMSTHPALPLLTADHFRRCNR